MYLTKFPNIPNFRKEVIKMPVKWTKPKKAEQPKVEKPKANKPKGKKGAK